MNILELYLINSGHDLASTCTALDRLQSAGIISDEVIFAHQVAWSDCERAIEWLKNNPSPTPD